MSFTIDELKEEIHDMVEHWERQLQQHLYEEYENIKKEIVSELYDEIAEKVDERYLSAYNFSLYSKGQNNNSLSNVYFISDGEFIKIGKADNVEVRLKQLQTSNAKPLFIIGYIQCKNSTSALRKENIIHRDFSKKKTNGEWFKIEIKDAIDTLKKYGGIVLKESEE